MSLQLDRLKYALVVLIPKKSKAKKFGVFRPISMLNASVKIVPKVLANQHREVLGDLIGDH